MDIRGERGLSANLKLQPQVTRMLFFFFYIMAQNKSGVCLLDQMWTYYLKLKIGAGRYG